MDAYVCIGHVRVKTVGMSADSLDLRDLCEKYPERAREVKDITFDTEKLGGNYWLTTLDKSKIMMGRVLSITDAAGEEEDKDHFISRFTPSTQSLRFSEVSEDGTLIFDILEEAGVRDKSVMTDEDRVKEAIAEAVKSGVVTEEDARARIDYMLANHVEWDWIKEVISFWQPHEKAVVKPSCLYVDMFLEEAVDAGREGVISRMLTHIVLGYAVIVESDRGLGKLVLTKTIAWLLGLPVYDAIFSHDMPQSVVYGEHKTDDTASLFLASEEAMQLALDAEKGETTARARLGLMKARAASVSVVIDRSEFYKCLADRGMMAVDELNCGDANFVERVFNPLLDGHGTLYFPGLGPMEAKRPFSLIATQNAGYEGTMEQNMATMSRFKFVRLEYPRSVRKILESAVEAELKERGIDRLPKREFIDQAEKFYDRIHRAFSGNLISDTALNIRGFVSSLVTVTVRPKASLNQFLQDGVINACPQMERALLTEQLNETVTL